MTVEWIYVDRSTYKNIVALSKMVSSTNELYAKIKGKGK